MDYPQGLLLSRTDKGYIYYPDCDDAEVTIGFGEFLVEVNDFSYDFLLAIIDHAPNVDAKIDEKFDDLQDSTLEWIYHEMLEYISPISADVISLELRSLLDFFASDSDSCMKKIEENMRTVGYLDEFKQTIAEHVGICDIGHTTFKHLLVSLSGLILFWLVINWRILDTLYGVDENGNEISRETANELLNTVLFKLMAGDQKTEYKLLCTESGVSEYYLVKNLRALIPFEVYNMIKNNVVINRCKNCDRYFIPANRSDEVYCTRISPQDDSMLCREYGTKRLWYEKAKSDELTKRSRNIYTKKQMLARRNPDIPSYQEAYDTFREERKKWIAAYKRGDVSAEEYSAWLDKQDAKHHETTN